MKSLLRTMSIAAVTMIFCGQVIAAPEAGSTDVRQVLVDLEKKMYSIETMQTNFFQKKKLSLFQHEVHLQGTLSMEKPDRLAWHTEQPVRYSIIFEKNKIYQWDEDTKNVQVLTFANAPILKTVIDQMQTWFYGSYVALLEQYDIRVISTEPLELEFIPHADVVSAAVIKAVTIRFMPDQSYIESLRIEEKNGDQSFLSFTDTILNVKIDPSAWKIENRG